MKFFLSMEFKNHHQTEKKSNLHLFFSLVKEQTQKAEWGQGTGSNRKPAHLWDSGISFIKSQITWVGRTAKLVGF